MNEFETWASGPQFGLTAGHFVKNEAGAYLNYPTQCYFEVWQAARATPCPGHERSECVSCCWPKGEKQAPEQTCQIGIYGRAYDGPGVTRAYTYHHQPDNVGASKLGQACYHAIQKPGGDSIDLGLGLLKHLQDAGFGVFEVKS